MSTTQISPIQKPFNVHLSLPGSKSLTNRALMMAALCEEKSVLENLLTSDDADACREAIQQLTTKRQIHCHDAGTVARFLLPVCAALGGEYHFDASSRLRERPIQPLIQILQQQGVRFDFLESPRQMPFVVHSSGLPGGNIAIDISDSSQFLSGLCMAAPLTKQGMIIQTNASIAKKPYVLMTLKLMQQFGIAYQYHNELTLEIFPGQYQATHLTIEPDASTASYFFAAAALTQSTIHIKDLTSESCQGDLKFLDLLEKIGCRIHQTTSETSVTGPERLQSLGEINMSGFTDTFMTLAIIAPFLPTPTTIHGLRHTRLQESDRVAAVSDGLMRLGIQTASSEDSLTIFPAPPQSNTIIHSHHDHRIAMAFSILGLKIPGISIEHAKCVSKTCPLFFQYLGELNVQ